MINIENISKHVESGNIKCIQHDQLFLYNYTQIAQFSQAWDDDVLKCRGLVMNSNFEIVNLPFKKFFNYNESYIASEFFKRIEQNETFYVYEKLDGSMICLFFDGKKWNMTTRGSFDNEQITNAKSIFYNAFGLDIDDPRDTDYVSGVFDINYTYIFEVIYPENKIVVDYGTERSLYLLGAVHKRTGNEILLKELKDTYIAYKDLRFPKTYEYTFHSLKKHIDNTIFDNDEGFVLHFPKDNFRVKMKKSEYVRLHKCVSSLSNMSVWESLKDSTFELLIETVPDEAFNFIHKHADIINEEYAHIVHVAVGTHQEIMHKISLDSNYEVYKNDKKLHRAVYANNLLNYQIEFSNKNAIRSLCFMLYDKKSIDKAAYSYVEPKEKKYFKFINE